MTSGDVIFSYQLSLQGAGTEKVSPNGNRVESSQPRRYKWRKAVGVLALYQRRITHVVH